MNKSCSYRHDTLDSHYNTTITLNTDEFPFYSFKNATGDTDTGTLRHVDASRVKINELLVKITGNSNEIAHLYIGDGDGLMGFTIHDITDGKNSTSHLFYFIELLAGSMDKHQIVNYRNELTHFTLTLYDVFIMHRDKVLNPLCVQIFLQNKFPAIGDAQSIPMQLRRLI